MPNHPFLTSSLIADTGHSRYYRIVYQVDGFRVAGFFGRPSPPGPHAAVIFNRGGNGEFAPLTGTEIVPFVEAGMVAAASQYRGGPGSEGPDDWGGDNARDVTRLVELLRALPEVDPPRIGMMGHSRGGMMTYLALKQDTLEKRGWIRAAVVAAGISDLFAWGRQRPSVVENIYRKRIGRAPQEEPGLFRDRSAVYWPELINVPLLLVHGDADERVPHSHSEMLAERLRAEGKTVDVQLLPGGDHLLRNHRGGYPQALDWFQRYLAAPGEDLSYRAHHAAITAARAQVKSALSPDRPSL